MHDTAILSGKLFAQSYGAHDKVVVDIGGLNINGSLRSFFMEQGMKYICVDITEHESVDIVVKPGEKLPFDNGSVDIIVSSSCFEHDPCFWLTFKEMTRITKMDGYIYISAPTNGVYHCCPGDNWRFYSDAGQALAFWSGKQVSNEEVFPVKVVETFHILPLTDIWIDFVCVWKRVDTIDSNILVQDDIVHSVGKLEAALVNSGVRITKKC